MSQKFSDETIAQMKDDLNALDGKGRHNTGSNIVRGDGIYANSLERRYNMSIQDMREVIKDRKSKAVKPNAVAPKAGPEAGPAMITKVEIHEFISRKPRGDRAVVLSPCSEFKVQVYNDKADEPFTAFTYNCYDNFHVTVRDREHGLKAAMDYATSFAKSIGFSGNIQPPRQFHEKIVSHTEWVEAT